MATSWLAISAASGLLISWATPATTVPMAASRDAKASDSWSLTIPVITSVKIRRPPTSPFACRQGRTSQLTQSVEPSARGNGSRSRCSTAPARHRR